MVVVTHRNQQRHGLGIKIPIKDRKCNSCNEIFKSRQGLKVHQSIKKNRRCWRAGMTQKRAVWVKEKVLYQSSWKKTKVQDHESFSVKHPKGKPFSKEKKETMLTFYQSMRDEGMTIRDAITKVARMGGIGRRSMERFVKEKIGTGTLRDNR